MIKITIEEAGKLTTYTSDSAIRSIEMWDGTAWTFGAVSRFADLARSAGHVVTELDGFGNMTEVNLSNDTIDLTHVVATDGAPIDQAAMADYLTTEAARK